MKCLGGLFYFTILTRISLAYYLSSSLLLFTLSDNGDVYSHFSQWLIVHNYLISQLVTAHICVMQSLEQIPDSWLSFLLGHVRDSMLSFLCFVVCILYCLEIINLQSRSSDCLSKSPRDYLAVFLHFSYFQYCFPMQYVYKMDIFID